MLSQFRESKYDQEMEKLINSLWATLRGPKPMKRAPAKSPAKGGTGHENRGLGHDSRGTHVQPR